MHTLINHQDNNNNVYIPRRWGKEDAHECRERGTGRSKGIGDQRD
jgi:hypothetical protein